jgi:hypothetical protein
LLLNQNDVQQHQIRSLRAELKRAQEHEQQLAVKISTLEHKNGEARVFAAKYAASLHTTQTQLGEWEAYFGGLRNFKLLAQRRIQEVRTSRARSIFILLFRR